MEPAKRNNYDIYTVLVPGNEGCKRTFTKDKKPNWCLQKLKSYKRYEERCAHYCTVTIIGLLTWGLLWCICEEDWRWGGRWFNIAATGAIAWAAGLLLEAVTSQPPLLAALLIGIVARNLDVIGMTDTNIDSLLRKIYPVVILGKASLGWDLDYMKANFLTVASIGVLPWCFEVMAVATCANLLLDFPWLWGLLLGCIYSSVSCAVVMPTVIRIGAGSRSWPKLVCTSGGIDTALSVLGYGIAHGLIFAKVYNIHSYVKASLSLVVGIVLGILWGTLARKIPNSRDPFATQLRILFVLMGGMFANFLTSYFEWYGTGGVAVLACNAAAAKQWERTGWKLNNNPASTAYRVMWSTLEPLLFVCTGSYFVIEKDSKLSNTLFAGFIILIICLGVRLIVVFIVCWKFSWGERLFVCCTVIPKSIVEAVLCPLPLVTLLSSGDAAVGVEMEYAEQVLRVVVQAILVTTPLGYGLTKYLGPKLLKTSVKTIESDLQQPQTKISEKEFEIEDTVYIE